MIMNAESLQVGTVKFFRKRQDIDIEYVGVSKPWQLLRRDARVNDRTVPSSKKFFIREARE
jgi:uncharacterized protein YijF (DUF1287 family)